MCIFLAEAILEDFDRIPTAGREGPLEALSADSTDSEFGGHCPETEGFIEDKDTSDEDSDGDRRPKLGEGFWGKGPPMMIKRGGWRLPRPLQDGGGMCSPGRWPPERRRLPAGASQRILLLILNHLRSWEDSGGSVKRAVFSLASGRTKASPFPDHLIAGMRSGVIEELKKAGVDPEERPGDRSKWISVRMVQALLKEAGDPGWKVLSKVAEGAPLGWREKLPRLPAIFERKRKWKPPRREDEDPSTWPDNYESVMALGSTLKDRFEKDEKEGMMKRVTLKEAREKYGERLRVAACGAVKQGPGEFRVTHDGTHGVEVNHDIRPRDQLRSPTGRDLRRVGEELYEEQVSAVVFALVFDASRAHRRIPTKEEDWGLQACSIGESAPSKDEDLIFLNLVGTYGLGSAAYWWGVMASSMVRVVHYVLGHQFPSSSCSTRTTAFLRQEAETLSGR
jgi:hypothetical protein